MKRTKSLKVNMLLNTIKGMMGILFPLITFRYVSGILGAANLGRYSFSSSIVSYFILFARLGINTYAIREGAKIRENVLEEAKFATQMFSINIVSTVCSYILLLFVYLAVNRLHEYGGLILILSAQIVFTTIGVEWVFSIYEDYLYMTIRSIIFQLLSLVLLFVFVKSANDLYVYTTITVISNVGSNLFNFIHARGYCKISITKKIEWKKHLKSILVLFTMTAAVTIYVSSDTTILGFMCGDSLVGIYSVSTRIYSVIKNIIGSVIVVSLPRLANIYARRNKDEFVSVAKDIYSTLLTVLMPSMVGLILLRRQVILIVSGKEFLQAKSSLLILCIALFFCFGAYFWGQCILVTTGKEALVLKYTVISAIINIVLNLILIPQWKENAAAFTTVAAEAVAFLCSRKSGRKYVKISMAKVVFKISIGCCAIAIIVLSIGVIVKNELLFTILSMALSIIAYLIIEIALKNEAIWSVVRTVKEKAAKRSEPLPVK